MPTPKKQSLIPQSGVKWSEKIVVLGKIISEWKWGVTKTPMVSFPMVSIGNCHVTVCLVVHHQEWNPQTLKCSTITFMVAASRQACNIQLGLNRKLSGCDHQHSSLALAVAMLCQCCCCCCCCWLQSLAVLNNKKIKNDWLATSHTW